jgi:glutathione S-transferase
MTYTLYIGNKRYSSWSMRPWVLLKALNIPFEEQLHLFVPGMRQPQFRAFSPSGKVPCLHDKSDAAAEPIVVWDSLAIAEYLAEKHPNVWPSPERPAARVFARCAAAEMHSGFAAIRDECSMNVGLRIDLGGPPGAKLQADLDRLSALFEYGLQKFGGPFLAGPEFTAVDAFYAPVASRCKTYGLVLGNEAARGYVERLLEQPGVKAWVDAGIREAEREPMHEEDCTSGRKVLEDLYAKSNSS